VFQSRRSRRRTAAAVPVAGALMLGLVLAACSSSSTPSAHAPSATGSAASATSQASGTVSSAKTAKYGSVLVDSSGKTLYMLSSDTSSSSTCTGSCASIWPPLTTTASPTAGSGVTSSLLGTITRSDGSHQVTYGGHPLYSYVQDTAAGQVKGQGIVAFGGTWYVVGTTGDAVTTAVPAAPTTTSGGYGY
jgi:predicted lipoprotein with Yx(FWY)xxD motif